MNIAALSGSQKLAGSSLAFLLMCAAALHAEGPEKLVRAGDALDEKNKNSEALSFYLDAAAQSPNDAEILRRISKQYAQLMLDAPDSREKKLLGEKAIDAAKSAVKADPANSQAHLALAIAYGRVALDESSRQKVEMDWFSRKRKPRRASIPAMIWPGTSWAVGTTSWRISIRF